MKHIGLVVVAGLLLLAVAGFADEVYERVVADLAKPGCTEVTFLSIIRSQVFEFEDTLAGVARMDDEGRYDITVGSDRYLCDLKHIYEYAQSTNQVVIVSFDSSSSGAHQLTCFTDIDRYYHLVEVVVGGKQYQLARRQGVGLDIPETLAISVDGKTERVSRMEYLDINDDLNTIMILNTETGTDCPPEYFLPNFPDSVERVYLDL